MRSVNIHEAKSTLSALLLDVETKGEVVVICRYGRPVAELRRPTPSRDRLLPNPALCGVVLHDDPATPLPADLWDALS
jgi:antitoxin (DNA-binding transcriptional repressor) of toxin-antitoxin stability system